MPSNVAPLSRSFMLTAILGFLISVIWVYPNAPSWGFAFSTVFALMFVASVVSTTYGPVEAEIKMDAPRAKRIKRK